VEVIEALVDKVDSTHVILMDFPSTPWPYFSAEAQIVGFR
jgi:hypothetical protein